MSTKTFQFHLEPPSKNDEELLMQQMMGGNIFRNSLIEIENSKRQEQKKIFLQIPRYSEIQDEISSYIEVLQETREKQSKINSENRKKGTSSDYKKEIGKIEKKIKNLRKEAKKIRKEKFAEIKEYNEIKKDIKDIEKKIKKEKDDKKIKKLEKEKQNMKLQLDSFPMDERLKKLIEEDERCSENIRNLNRGFSYEDKRTEEPVFINFGTKDLYRNAAKQAGKGVDVIKYKKFNGGGQIAVQIQTQTGQEALSPERLFAGCSNKVKLEKVPKPIIVPKDPSRKIPIADPNSNRSKREQFCNLKINIGYKKEKYLTFSMKMHRQFPKDCKITWVKVVKFKQGPTVKYKALFTVELNQTMFEIKKEVSKGELKNIKNYICYDPGWRKTKDGIKILHAVDNKGNTQEIILGYEDELIITNGNKKRFHPEKTNCKRSAPLSIWAGLEKEDDLKSIRDKMFNDIIVKIKNWINKNKEVCNSDIIEYTSHIHQWKDKKRIRKLQKKVEQCEKLPRDYEKWQELEILLKEWNKQDLHLWKWQTNLRQQCLDRRKDFYYNIVKAWSEKYDAVVIENISLDKLARREKPESDKSNNSTAQKQRSAVAHSVLINILLNSFEGAVYKAEAKYTTKKCNECGKIDLKWKNPSEEEHTCPHCQKTWNRDLNAAKNIENMFREHLGGVENPGITRADKKIKEYKELAKNGGKRPNRYRGGKTKRGQALANGKKNAA